LNGLRAGPDHGRAARRARCGPAIEPTVMMLQPPPCLLELPPPPRGIAANVGRICVWPFVPLEQLRPATSAMSTR
jgi:hypothetical protein